jgi:retron-type reverse transcriptase
MGPFLTGTEMAKSLYSRLHSKAFSLRPAWSKVREACLSSESRKTREAAKAFDRRAEKNLENIYRKLQRGTYQFSPAEGVPRSQAGKTPRPIVVADLPDRVVQRALLVCVTSEEAVKEFVKNPGSFGGLRDTGVRDAIQTAVERIDGGAAYYIKSDIPGFFTKVPRKRTLSDLCGLLPDGSIDDILDQATTVELANLASLRERADLFPSHELGVAQGCSLSPLLGNVCLHDFDVELNRGEGVCLRYIDDFLILAPDKSAAWALFRKAKSLLGDMGMEAYDPRAHPEKASEGSTQSKFEFLGCEISQGFIHPSASSRRRILKKVRKILSESRSAFLEGVHSRPEGHEFSVVETLSLVSNTQLGE